MYIIFRCYYQQFINYWKSLGLRFKIEILILIVVFFSFFSVKLIIIFSDLLTRPTITDIGLNSFIGHFISLLLFLTMPFIYFKLIPRQESLQTLRVLPLSSNNALAVLLTYIARYEFFTLIISGPVFIALLITTGILPVLYYLFILSIFPVTSLLLLQFLLKKNQNRVSVTFIYFFILIAYFIIHSFLYLNNYYYMLIDILLFPAMLALLFRGLHPFADHWDLPIHILQIKENVLRKVKYSVTYDQIPGFLPAGIQPYFSREILGHIRNRNYMRMKILSLLLFIIILIFLGNTRPDFIPVLCFIFCWLHYAHQFNEKYIFSESKDLITTLPVRYYQIWFSKFVSEIILLLPILIISLFALMLYEAPVIKGLMIFSALVLFSILLLFIITNIRLIFLENVRMAGYAYHFLVIFSVIMIANFFLVGPIVILGLLVYLSILSYRQLSH